jgi:hypothetical protein
MMIVDRDRCIPILREYRPYCPEEFFHSFSFRIQTSHELNSIRWLRLDQVQCGTLKDTGQLAKILNLLQRCHLLNAHRLLHIPPLPCRLSSGHTRA